LGCCLKGPLTVSLSRKAAIAYLCYVGCVPLNRERWKDISKDGVPLAGDNSVQGQGYHEGDFGVEKKTARLRLSVLNAWQSDYQRRSGTAPNRMR
jgi:hypothetical protein